MPPVYSPAATATTSNRIVRRCATHHLELDESSVIVTRAGSVLGGTLICPALARHRVRTWEVFIPGFDVVALASLHHVTILRPEVFPPVVRAQ